MKNDSVTSVFAYKRIHMPSVTGTCVFVLTNVEEIHFPVKEKLMDGTHRIMGLGVGHTKLKIQFWARGGNFGRFSDRDPSCPLKYEK